MMYKLSKLELINFEIPSKEKNQHLMIFDYESVEVSEVKEETLEEYLTKPVQTTNLP